MKIKLVISIWFIILSAILSAKTDYKSLLVGRWSLCGENCDKTGNNCEKKITKDITEFKNNGIVIISGEICWYKVKDDQLTIAKSDQTGYFAIVFLKNNTLFINMTSVKTKNMTDEKPKKTYNALFIKITGK